MANQQLFRDTWAEIDLGAIRENIAKFQQYLQKPTKIMAVVKANAYGHGAVEVARVAIEAGVDHLAVALLDEAIALRQAGIRIPILVLGWVRPQDVNKAAHYDITLTVFQASWLLEALAYSTSSLRLHLKIDTGMGRIGVRDMREAEAILSFIEQHNRVTLEGVYTHFATADEDEGDFFLAQQKRFEQWLTWLSKRGERPEVIHASNSAGALRIPHKSYHYVRLGIAMYGLEPSVEMTLPFSLHQAFSLHSRLIHVKQLPPGEPISYGATYRTSGWEWIGTIPIGYADGWIRKLANSAEVLVDGERAPVVGRICMDLCMVRLPRKMKVGTKVTLIGEQGNEKISVAEIAEKLDTITYEVPCMIAARVPRIYVSQASARKTSQKC